MSSGSGVPDDQDEVVRVAPKIQIKKKVERPPVKQPQIVLEKPRIINEKKEYPILVNQKEISPVVETVENIPPVSPVVPTARKKVLSDLEQVKRPCGSHMELNTHFANRNHWQKLTGDELHEKSQQWKEFLAREVPMLRYDQMNYNGRGIVYLANGNTLNRSIASIQLLRDHGCNLPVEVWYIGDELTSDQKKRLVTEIKVQPRDILVEQQKAHMFKKYSLDVDYGYERNYQIKTFVLLLTKFKELLYLDSDNMPLKNPEYLFDSEEFKQIGAVFWNDFWKFPTDNPMWQITGQLCSDEWEQESGQLLLDKEKAWRGLLMSLHFQSLHEFYFNIILGDKDTYRFGFMVSETPYHTIRHPVGIAGRIRQEKFCGHSMVQPDMDGNFLFVHTTSMKTTSSIHKGNTWEAIQYLQRSHPLEFPSSNPALRNFLVSYPVANEFSGGVDKTTQQGGTGQETFANPCLEFNIQSMEISRPASLVEQLGPSEAVDSFKVVVDHFKLYNNGSFADFEEKYYKFGGIGTLRTEATCGNGHVGNGKCMDSSLCCSKFGYCGNNVDYCGVNCFGGPCYRNRKLPAKRSADFPYCGNGKMGFGICKDPSACCTVHAWCGIGPEHCNPKICVSGPCLSENQTK
jgi:hypothetical protein